MEGIAANLMLIASQSDIKISEGGAAALIDTDIANIDFKEMIANLDLSDIAGSMDVIVGDGENNDSSSLLSLIKQEAGGNQQSATATNINIELRPEVLTMLQSKVQESDKIGNTIIDDSILGKDEQLAKQKQAIDKILDETGNKGSAVKIEVDKDGNAIRQSDLTKITKPQEKDIAQELSDDAKLINKTEQKSKSFEKKMDGNKNIRSTSGNSNSDNSSLLQANTKKVTSLENPQQQNGGGSNQQGSKGQDNAKGVNLYDNQTEINEDNKNTKKNTDIKFDVNKIDSKPDKAVMQNEKTHNVDGSAKLRSVDQITANNPVEVEKIDKTDEALNLKSLKISDQIVHSVRKNLPFSGVVKSYNIHLNPKDMGEVNVRMQIEREGVIKASFMIEEFKTFDALQQNSNTLQKSLEDAGYKVEKGSLSFSMNNQGAGGGNSGGEKNEEANRIYKHGRGLLSLQEVDGENASALDGGLMGDNHNNDSYRININIKV